MVAARFSRAKFAIHRLGNIDPAVELAQEGELSYRR
jgi:hypothetical protein